MGRSAVDMDSGVRNEMGPGGLPPFPFLGFVARLWSVIWHHWAVCIFGSESSPASDMYETKLAVENPDFLTSLS